MKLARTNAIFSFNVSPTESLVGREGTIVRFLNGFVVPLDDPTDSEPIGVVLEGGAYPGKASIALAAGGLAGTVRVRLGENVTVPGTPLMPYMTQHGAVFAPAASSGARIVMAQAVETGAAGEFIEAVLFKPRLIGMLPGEAIPPFLA